MERLTDISASFLFQDDHLDHVNLASLRSVKAIPESFLSGCCSSLRQIDLTPLANLRVIGGRFLQNCKGLASINLAPLRAVEELPDGFLACCSGLRDLDLSPLVGVKKVGVHFLFGCTGLASINLAPLWAVEELPDNFLAGCSGLREVDLAPLVGLKEVRWSFLANCSALTRINFSPLRLRGVGPYFLQRCCTLS